VKWEYKVIDVKKAQSFWTGKTDVSQLEQELNGLGKLGWELVSVARATAHHASGNTVAVLKRSV